LRPEREMSHSPLFQVLLVLQNMPMEEMHWPGVSVSGVEVERFTSKLDLTLGLGESEHGLEGSVEYNTDLFERETIERIMGHYERALSALVADVEQPVSDWTLLSDAEQQQLLVEWNATSVYPRDYCIHELFAEQAKRTPHAVALLHGEQRISYSELNERANQLAHYLLSLGLTAEARVGLLLPRSPELVIAMLGVLKAGMTYLPLDAAYPAERLRFMVEDGDVPLCSVTNSCWTQCR